MSANARPSAVLLGADAGGSHSTVVIGTVDLTILGRADGPGAAMKPGGAAASAVVLAETARRAASQTGIDLPVDRAVVGAAGAGRAQEQGELEAALVQAGRGEGSTLLARLLGPLGLQTFDDLVRWTATATPAQVAALAPHVLNAAREGEVVAQRAVEDAARELVALVVTLERYYPGTEPVPVAIAGGLLLAQSPLAAAFRDRLAAQSKRARVVSNRVDTPVGALKLAAEME